MWHILREKKKNVDLLVTFSQPNHYIYELDSKATFYEEVVLMKVQRHC